MIRETLFPLQYVFCIVFVWCGYSVEVQVRNVGNVNFDRWLEEGELCISGDLSLVGTTVAGVECTLNVSEEVIVVLRERLLCDCFIHAGYKYCVL